MLVKYVKRNDLERQEIAIKGKHLFIYSIAASFR